MGMDKIIGAVQILLQYFNDLFIILGILIQISLCEFTSIVDRFIYLLDCIFVNKLQI